MRHHIAEATEGHGFLQVSYAKVAGARAEKASIGVGPGLCGLPRISLPLTWVNKHSADAQVGAAWHHGSQVGWTDHPRQAMHVTPGRRETERYATGPPREPPFGPILL
jgi:hypothetical protein